MALLLSWPFMSSLLPAHAVACAASLSVKQLPQLLTAEEQLRTMIHTHCKYAPLILQVERFRIMLQLHMHVSNIICMNYDYA